MACLTAPESPLIMTKDSFVRLVGRLMAVEDVVVDPDALGHDHRFATPAIAGFELAVVLRLG